jgi:hypothetical protein
VSVDTIRVMSEFRRRHSVVDVIWVLLTGPLVVFAVTDWFLKLLPTPVSVAVGVLALAAALLLAYRLDRSDGLLPRRGGRGYRGRHSPGPQAGDSHEEPPAKG